MCIKHLCAAQQHAGAVHMHTIVAAEHAAKLQQHHPIASIAQCILRLFALGREVVKVQSILPAKGHRGLLTVDGHIVEVNGIQVRSLQVHRTTDAQRATDHQLVLFALRPLLYVRLKAEHEDAVLGFQSDGLGEYQRLLRSLVHARWDGAHPTRRARV